MEDKKDNIRYDAFFIKMYFLSPWQWAKRHLGGGVVLYQPGTEQMESFVHPSLMPVLVAKAVSCLGHIRKKKEKKRKKCIF